MTLPDNRMRFDPGPIDFATEVGLTGQDHDDYPMVATQPRYDWMRMSLIALLSQQSSYDAPTQYREGTPWFDLNTMVLRIRRNSQWVPYASAVLLEDDTTLAEFYAEYKALNLSPTVRFYGTATSVSTSITIPPAIVASIAGKSNLVTDVFINGSLMYPGNTSLGASQITLSGGVTLAVGGTYVVKIYQCQDC